MNSFTLLISKILLISFFSFSFNSAYSAPAKTKVSKLKKDSSSDLYLQGHIVVKNKEVKGIYKVEVLYYNAVASSFTVKNNESIKLLLKRDAPYVLKISKKGFRPQYICVNTNMHGSRNLIHSFYFETNLISPAQAMLLDDEALELPIAMISFNKSTGSFANNKDYTSYVNQRIYGTSDGTRN